MFHDIMVRKMLYGYVAATSVMSASTVYFGDVSYTDHAWYFKNTLRIRC